MYVTFQNHTTCIQLASYLCKNVIQTRCFYEIVNYCMRLLDDIEFKFEKIYFDLKPQKFSSLLFLQSCFPSQMTEGDRHPLLPEACFRFWQSNAFSPRQSTIKYFKILCKYMVIFIITYTKFHTVYSTSLCLSETTLN